MECDKIGERYLVTGVQLGLLISISSEQARQEIVNVIVQNQFVANTENTNVVDDANKVSNLWFGKLSRN